MHLIPPIVKSTHWIPNDEWLCANGWMICRNEDIFAHLSHPSLHPCFMYLNVMTCDDEWFFLLFFFYPFIYHMYLYSQSHDWQPFLSHMTYQESSFTFSCDSSSHDSCWLMLTHSDSLVFHLLCFTFVSWLVQEHPLFSLPIVPVTSLFSVMSNVPVMPLFPFTISWAL